MGDAVGVELGAKALRDQVDVVVLEVLRYARDKRHTHRGGEQHRDATEELAGRVFGEPRRVVVDDVPEDQRVEQREDLVDRGETERERDERPILAQIREKQRHASDYTRMFTPSSYGRAGWRYLRFAY